MHVVEFNNMRAGIFKAYPQSVLERYGFTTESNTTCFSAGPSVFRLKQQIPRLRLALQLASAGSSQLPKSARKTDPSGTLRFLSHRGIGCIARQRLADSYFAQQH